jgi:hypothetical protein
MVGAVPNHTYLEGIFQMTNFVVKHRKLWFVLFMCCFCLMLCACSVNWVSEVQGSIAAFSPALAAFFALLTAFGVKIPSSVLTTVQKLQTQITNTLDNVVLPLIEQYNAAEVNAKPGILGQIQSAMASVTSQMGEIETALASAGLSASAQAKVNAIWQALVVQVNAITAFLPVIEGDEANVKAAVNAGTVPMNAEQWATHFNQVLVHGTGDGETDAAVASVTPITVGART